MLPPPEARQRKLLVIETETETDRPGFIEITEGQREVVVRSAAAPRFTGLSIEVDYASYEAAIRSLLPGTRRVSVVGGLTYGDVLGEVATARLRRATGLEVTPLAGLTVAELIRIAVERKLS